MYEVKMRTNNGSRSDLTIINVGGVGRSGTTMLHLMLGNAPDAFACGEVQSWFRPDMKHHFRITCPCGNDPCPVWQKLRHLEAHQFHVEACRRLNVKFVIDASKALSWFLDVRRWAGTTGPDVFNVFIWKDLVDLAHSFWKRGYPRMLWRAEFVKYYRRLEQCGLPVIAVNYNELVREPKKKLADLCRVLGMEYFDGKERFWEKESHHLFSSFGVRQQLEAKDSQIREVEEVPSEFLDHAEFVRRTIATDGEVKRLIEFLRRHDVSVYNGPRAQQRFVPRQPFPPWYYWHRAKRWRWFRKRFPRPFPVNPLNEKAL